VVQVVQEVVHQTEVVVLQRLAPGRDTRAEGMGKRFVSLVPGWRVVLQVPSAG